MDARSAMDLDEDLKALSLEPFQLHGEWKIQADSYRTFQWDELLSSLDIPDQDVHGSPGNGMQMVSCVRLQDGDVGLEAAAADHDPRLEYNFTAPVVAAGQVYVSSNRQQGSVVGFPLEKDLTIDSLGKEIVHLDTNPRADIRDFFVISVPGSASGLAPDRTILTAGRAGCTSWRKSPDTFTRHQTFTVDSPASFVEPILVESAVPQTENRTRLDWAGLLVADRTSISTVDVSHCRVMSTHGAPDAGTISSLKSSPLDPNIFSITTSEGRLCIYDTRQSSGVAVVQVQPGLYAQEVFRAGACDLIAAAGLGGTIRLFDMRRLNQDIECQVKDPKLRDIGELKVMTRSGTERLLVAFGNPGFSTWEIKDSTTGGESGLNFGAHHHTGVGMMAQQGALNRPYSVRGCALEDRGLVTFDCFGYLQTWEWQRSETGDAAPADESAAAICQMELSDQTRA